MTKNFLNYHQVRLYPILTYIYLLAHQSCKIEGAKSRTGVSDSIVAIPYYSYSHSNQYVLYIGLIPTKIFDIPAPLCMLASSAKDLNPA